MPVQEMSLLSGITQAHVLFAILFVAIAVVLICQGLSVSCWKKLYQQSVQLYADDVANMKSMVAYQKRLAFNRKLLLNSCNRVLGEREHECRVLQNSIALWKKAAELSWMSARQWERIYNLKVGGADERGSISKKT